MRNAVDAILFSMDTFCCLVCSITVSELLEGSYIIVSVNSRLPVKEIANIDHYLQIEMLEYRQSRLQMDPLNCNEVSPSSENLDSLEFCRVLCRGVFNEKKSIFIGPRSRSISGVTENGYYVITPLMPLANDPKRYMYITLSQHSFVH